MGRTDTTHIYRAGTIHQNEERYFCQICSKKYAKQSKLQFLEARIDIALLDTYMTTYRRRKMANGDATRALRAIADIADSRWSFWQFRFGPFGDLCLRNPLPAVTHNNDNNGALEGSLRDRQTPKKRRRGMSEQRNSPNLTAFFRREGGSTPSAVITRFESLDRPTDRQTDRPRPHADAKENVPALRRRRWPTNFNGHC